MEYKVRESQNYWKREIEEAMQWYRTTFIKMKKENFVGDAPYRFFKIIPSSFHILDPDTDVDKRVEVFLLNKHNHP